MQFDDVQKDADLFNEKSGDEDEAPLMSEIISKEYGSKGNNSPSEGQLEEPDQLAAARILNTSDDEALPDSLLDIPVKKNCAHTISIVMSLFLWVSNIILFEMSQGVTAGILGVSTFGLVLALFPSVARFYAVGRGYGTRVPDYYSGDPYRPTPLVAIKFLGFTILTAIFLFLIITAILRK